MSNNLEEVTSIPWESFQNDMDPLSFNTAICPISVFDKFGNDIDALNCIRELEDILDLGSCIKTEPFDEYFDSSMLNGDVESLFPDLSDFNFLDDKYNVDLTQIDPLPLPVIDQVKEEPYDPYFEESCNTMNILAESLKVEETTTEPVTTHDMIPCADKLSISVNSKIPIMPEIAEELVNHEVVDNSETTKGNLSLKSLKKENALLPSMQNNMMKPPVRVNSTSKKAVNMSQKRKAQLNSKRSIAIERKVPVRPETPPEEDEDRYRIKEENLLNDFSQDLLSACFTSDKFTPKKNMRNSNQSPDNLNILKSFYKKTVGKRQSEGEYNVSLSNFYSKSVTNLDHNYDLTSRSVKSPIFNIESLGIQTPSASEPPTDSDEEEIDVTGNYFGDSDEEDEEVEEQEEVLDDSRYKYKMAELMKRNRNGNVENGRKKSSVKRKLSCNTSDMVKAKIIKSSTKENVDKFMLENNAIITSNGTGSLRLRIPGTKGGNCKSSLGKRKRCGSNGRMFTASERYVHNTNEQARRIEMRQSFEELRLLVPSLQLKPKAPKVLILQEAKAFCDEIYFSDCKIQTRLSSLQAKQETIKSKLSQLRRLAASARNM